MPLSIRPPGGCCESVWQGAVPGPAGKHHPGELQRTPEKDQLPVPCGAAAHRSKVLCEQRGLYGRTERSSYGQRERIREDVEITVVYRGTQRSGAVRGRGRGPEHKRPALSRLPPGGTSCQEH